MKYIEGYVAFIDILGFSQFVSEENNGDKTEKLFSFVDKFCYLFNTSPNLKVKVSFFSDSIVLSSENFANLIAPIYIAESFLKSELGLLFRGGITKGKYYNTNGVTFGPAVVKAYNLEESAKYSRVIIDDIVVNEQEDCFEIFKDIDGKYCLNLSSFIVVKSNKYGNGEVKYPSGNPATNILRNFEEERESILCAIKKHIGTDVSEKYLWRIRPFNYTCEAVAASPIQVKPLDTLNQDELKQFSARLLDERITIIDASSLQSKTDSENINGVTI